MKKENDKQDFYRDFFAIMDKSDESSSELIRAERSLDFELIVTYHIEAVRCYPADAVKYKDSLIPSVEDNIILRQSVLSACWINASSRPGIKRGYML